MFEIRISNFSYGHLHTSKFTCFGKDCFIYIGDLAIEGEIVEYRTTPVAIQGDQTAALNRLTIGVNVRFTNIYEPDKDFEQKFTQFQDYPSDTDLNAAKDELILVITEMLSTDIFNKAVINW